ncbi:MAG TPA: LuxR C-terminal-related transcriptional regulator, partial [Micromonosporaceae bacterium]|nr:LuxR C-terminal-related transcriptional regulator [Micromonosporaceae bacterium]
MDRHDNDPQIFWAYVVAALRLAGAVAQDNPLVEMGSVPADEGERGHRLAAGLSHLPKGTILVLDDFQEIDDTQILRELADLLRHPPARFRMIVISRGEPPLSLHRLRLAGQVAEIRAADLAFTGEEASALVAGHGLTLSAEDVTTLLHRTEGWATGLHLGAGFIAGTDGARSIAEFTGDIRGVDEYLTEEVLAGRSWRHRRFLLETSICGQVCADLANAITTHGDGQRTLEQLEHDTDFVLRLGPKPLWFRYHHLFRDVLTHRLRLETPRTVSALHVRAARWYAANNSVMEALAHAVSARDWPYVGRLVATQGAPLILSAHRPVLVKILQQVPRDKLTSTPELMVCAALLAFHAGDYDAIPAPVNRARELLRRRTDSVRRQVEVLLLALQVAADRAVGDMPAVVALENELLALLTTEPFAEVAAGAQFRAIAMNSRGLALLWSGQPEAAARDLWAATAAARAAGVELVEINAAGHLALLQVMCGSVHEAAELAESTRNLAERRAWRYALQTVAAHFAQALVHLERNELEAAHEALRQGQRAHQSDPEAAQRLVQFVVQARLALARGEPGKARYFIDEARRDRHERLQAPALDEWLSLVEAEIELATGRPERVRQHYAHRPPNGALGLAQRVCYARAAFATGDLRGAEALLKIEHSSMSRTVATVEAGILAAKLADARGDTARAVDLLADTATLAAREGIRRPFITMAGRRLDALFDRLRLLVPTATPFIAAVIVDKRTAAPSGDTEGLSGREAQVMRYLPTMLTAAEIAADLGVSVYTVRTQMKSIYR